MSFKSLPLPAVNVRFRTMVNLFPRFHVSGTEVMIWSCRRTVAVAITFRFRNEMLTRLHFHVFPKMVTSSYHRMCHPNLLFCLPKRNTNDSQHPKDGPKGYSQAFLIGCLAWARSCFSSFPIPLSTSSCVCMHSPRTSPPIHHDAMGVYTNQTTLLFQACRVTCCLLFVSDPTSELSARSQTW